MGGGGELEVKLKTNINNPITKELTCTRVQCLGQSFNRKRQPRGNPHTACVKRVINKCAQFERIRGEPHHIRCLAGYMPNLSDTDARGLELRMYCIEWGCRFHSFFFFQVDDTFLAADLDKQLDPATPSALNQLLNIVISSQY